MLKTNIRTIIHERGHYGIARRYTRKLGFKGIKTNIFIGIGLATIDRLKSLHDMYDLSIKRTVYMPKHIINKDLIDENDNANGVTYSNFNIFLAKIQ
jgi:hypothetical protein